jgi:hypothetical protein
MFGIRFGITAVDNTARTLGSIDKNIKGFARNFKNAFQVGGLLLVISKLRELAVTIMENSSYAKQFEEASKKVGDAWKNVAGNIGDTFAPAISYIQKELQKTARFYSEAVKNAAVLGEAMANMKFGDASNWTEAFSKAKKTVTAREQYRENVKFLEEEKKANEDLQKQKDEYFQKTSNNLTKLAKLQSEQLKYENELRKAYDNPDQSKGMKQAKEAEAGLFRVQNEKLDLQKAVKEEEKKYMDYLSDPKYRKKLRDEERKKKHQEHRYESALKNAQRKQALIGQGFHRTFTDREAAAMQIEALRGGSKGDKSVIAGPPTMSTPKSGKDDQINILNDIRNILNKGLKST